MTQKSVLGKGLASLLPGAGSAQHSGQQFGAQHASALPAGAMAGTQAAGLETAMARHPGIALASLEEIEVNPYQPRREFDETALSELADSIKVSGLIQPLIVRRTANGYQLIAGERRLRASKLAGLKQVPIVIKRSTDKESLEIAIIENIQRQDLNCVEEALAYQRLIEEFQLTQEEAAKRVGKERASVANTLRLLKLPEAILDDLKRGILSFGHGKLLCSLEDMDSRLRARAQIVEKKLSVRESEVLIEGIKRGEQAQAAAVNAQAAAPSAPTSPAKQRLANLSQEFARQLSVRVEIKGSERKGKIVFHYSNRQELDRLIAHVEGEHKVWPRT